MTTLQEQPGNMIIIQQQFQERQTKFPQKFLGMILVSIYSQKRMTARQAILVWHTKTSTKVIPDCIDRVLINKPVQPETFFYRMKRFCKQQIEKNRNIEFLEEKQKLKEQEQQQNIQRVFSNESIGNSLDYGQHRIPSLCFNLHSQQSIFQQYCNSQIQHLPFSSNFEQKMQQLQARSLSISVKIITKIINRVLKQNRVASMKIAFEALFEYF